MMVTVTIEHMTFDKEKFLDVSQVSPAFVAMILNNSVLTEDGTKDFKTIFGAGQKLIEGIGIKLSNNTGDDGDKAGTYGRIYALRCNEEFTDSTNNYYGWTSRRQDLREGDRYHNLRDAGKGMAFRIPLAGNDFVYWSRTVCFTTDIDLEGKMKAMEAAVLRSNDATKLQNLINASDTKKSKNLAKFWTQEHQVHAVAVFVLAHLFSPQSELDTMVKSFGAPRIRPAATFDCDLCPRWYSYRNGLRKHKLFVHGVKCQRKR